MGRAYENDLKQRQRFCLRKGEERGIVFILSVGHFPGISLKLCRTVAAVDAYGGGLGDENPSFLCLIACFKLYYDE